MIALLAKRDPSILVKETLKRKRKLKIAHIKRIIGYVLSVALVIGGNYVVLVVSANNTAEESTKWSKKFMISFAQDLGVNQVIKVVLTCILLRVLMRTRGRGKFAK